MNTLDVFFLAGLSAVALAVVGHAVYLWVQRERHIIRVDLSGDGFCGLCRKGGAKTRPAAVRWPGQRDPQTDFVHYHCQVAEAARACEELSEAERDRFLRREFGLK